MQRRIILTLLVALFLFGIVPGAAAAEPADAAAAVLDDGFYREPGTRIDAGDVSDAVRTGRDAGYRYAIVVLRSEPAGGATTFADAVLDRVGDGTIFVLTEDGYVGYSSTEFDRSAIETALDYADARGGSDAEYLGNFTGALVGAPVGPGVTTTAASSSSGGGGGGLWILLLVVAGLVALVWFATRGQKKRSAARSAQEIAEARAEIQAQLDSAANDILEFADQVSVAENPEAQEHFEAAGAAYNAASDEFEKATDLAALEALSVRLDETIWRLDVVEAVLEGRPKPPKPKPEEPRRCFFDPTHRGPFEEAAIETAAGTKQVTVCRADAERLRRGQRPEPRMIEYQGRRIPAAQAPRSHGGLGLSGMDVLSMIVQGMAAASALGWGSGRRRSGGGGLGGLFPRSGGGSRSSGGGWSSTRSSRSSSRSSTRSSSRSSSRSSGGRARGGRRRR